MNYLRIKELMKIASVSNTDLAKALDVSAKTASFIINEKTNASYEQLDKIAELLGVDIPDLFVSNRGKGSTLYTQDENDNYVEVGYLRN